MGRRKRQKKSREPVETKPALSEEERQRIIIECGTEIQECANEIAKLGYTVIGMITDPLSKEPVTYTCGSTGGNEIIENNPHIAIDFAEFCRERDPRARSSKRKRTKSISD